MMALRGINHGCRNGVDQSSNSCTGPEQTFVLIDCMSLSRRSGGVHLMESIALGACPWLISRQQVDDVPMRHYDKLHRGLYEQSGSWLRQSVILLAL